MISKVTESTESLSQQPIASEKKNKSQNDNIRNHRQASRPHHHHHHHHPRRTHKFVLKTQSHDQSQSQQKRPAQFSLKCSANSLTQSETKRKIQDLEKEIYDLRQNSEEKNTQIQALKEQLVQVCEMIDIFFRICISLVVLFRRKWKGKN